MGFTQLKITIIELCCNLWHKLLPNTAVNVFGSLQDIPPGNWLDQKPAQITESQASFFRLCLWFSISLAGGIALASTKASAQWGEQ